MSETTTLPVVTSAPIVNITEAQSELRRQYNKVFQSGKLTNVHVGMWSMKVKTETEDGADAESSEVKRKLLASQMTEPGSDYLIKREVYKAFKKIEGEARNFLYRNSFQFPMVPQARFVPRENFSTVFTGLREIQGRYLAMVEEFCTNYEQYKEHALAYYREQGASENRINVLRTRYPDPDRLRQKFYFDIGAFEITYPSEFGQYDLQTESARVEAAQKAQEEASQFFQAQVSRQLAATEDFISSASTELRNRVGDMCQGTLDRVKRVGRLTDSAAESLLTEIRAVRLLNFMDDKVVTELLDGLTAELTTSTPSGDPVASISRRLTQATDTISRTLDNSGATAVSFLRNLDI